MNDSIKDNEYRELLEQGIKTENPKRYKPVIKYLLHKIQSAAQNLKSALTVKTFKDKREKGSCCDRIQIKDEGCVEPCTACLNTVTETPVFLPFKIPVNRRKQRCMKKH